jgi:hypothetical protein
VAIATEQKAASLPSPKLLRRSNPLVVAMSAEMALQKGKENGFDCDAHPKMKQFFIHYIDSHTDTNNAST